MNLMSNKENEFKKEFEKVIDELTEKRFESRTALERHFNITIGYCRSILLGNIEFPNRLISRLANEYDEFSSLKRFVIERKCSVCGESFYPVRQTMTACSIKCKQIEARHERYKRKLNNRICEGSKLAKVEEMARQERKSYGHYVMDKRLAEL
ncbi:MAG: hypothetical protein ACRCU3_08440 [Eubacteriaceae bacterium]